MTTRWCNYCGDIARAFKPRPGGLCNPCYKMDQAPAKPEVCKMATVLQQVSIPPCIDVSELKRRVASYMESRREFYAETGRGLYIEDEFSEYWTAKATKGTEIGRGSGGMDVKAENGDGIDAMCVIMNRNGSNEKSLTQNFSVAGAQLDQLFEEGKDTDALGLFLTGYAEKIRKVREENSLKDLFILAFVSTTTDVHAVCFQLFEDRILSATSGGFVKGGDRNINANGFIDPSDGNVKLYKSKKRLELRLNRAVIASPHTVTLWSLTPAVAPVAEQLA